jgi:flagellar protein FlaF
MSYSVYKSSQHKSMDTRDTEYRLLAQVTAAMLEAKEKTGSVDVRQRVDAALWNRDVWAALRTDLSMDGNGLPKELRASLISVSLWIEKECIRVVEGEGDLNALIEVNRNIMSGLKPDSRSDDGNEEPPAESSGFNSGALTGGFATAI